jgi:hypothetical protein
MTKKLLALSALALALLPLACSSGEDDSGDGAAGSAETRSAGDSGGGGGSVEVGDGGGDEAAGPQQLPSVGERIIQTATIRLTVKKDGLEAAVERARSVADEFGGFVVRSSSSLARRGRPQQASIVIRVPNRSYSAALGSLSEVGRIEARRESAEGVSQEFVDLEARTRHLRAVELQMLELLNKAQTVPAALAVQDRLSSIQLELEQVRGRLRFLEDQTAYATISLSVRERGPVAPVAGEDGWGIVEAWKDGAQAFVKVAGRAFVVLAGAAPLILLAVLAFLALRAARRRSLFGWGAPRPQ